MKKNKMVTIHIIALLFLLVGLAVTTASTVLLISYNKKSKSFEPITATVVGYKEKTNGLKAIIIEYNIDDKFYKLTSKHYDKKPEPLDRKIKIKYNPKNHSEIIWVDNNRNHKYLIAGLILLFGDAIIWMISYLSNQKNKVQLAEMNRTRAFTVPLKNKKTEEIDYKENIEKSIEQKNESKIENFTQNTPLFEEEEIPDIFKPNNEENIGEIKSEELSNTLEIDKPIIIEENNENVLELEKTISDEKNEKTQKIEFPQIIKSEEPVRLNIPEIPYDLDSPREAILSNVMETTIAIPTLNKEIINLNSITPEEQRKFKINENMKSEALSKLLDDIEKNS